MKNLNLDNKTVTLDTKEFFEFFYNSTPDMIFSIDKETKQIYILTHKFEISNNANETLNVLRQYGLNMSDFYNDFYNKGYCLEQQNSYMYLNENPLNVLKLNAMCIEDNDLFLFRYTDTNLIFFIKRDGDVNILNYCDIDTDDCFNNPMTTLLLNDELKQYNIDVDMFKRDFEGLLLTAGKASRII